jgi:archaemetzincin
VAVSLVHIVPLYLPGSPQLIDDLSSALGRIFAAQVVVRAPRFDPESTFDSSRGQYNSTALLRQLLAEAPDSDGRVLGVAGVDLFIPILTYVFGEAQLDGTAAVVSTYRLDNALYGLPGNERLLRERLLKESVHELGHTFGLVHCDDPVCVMRSSTYVEDIDLKGAQFCVGCAKRVRASSSSE